MRLLRLELDVKLFAPEHQLLVLFHHLVILELLKVDLVWQSNLLVLAKVGAFKIQSLERNPESNWFELYTP